MRSSATPRSPSPRFGRPGLRAVVDTSVWVSGLINPYGTPGRLIEAVRVGRLQPVVSWALLREMVDVLARPQLRRFGIDDSDIESLVATLGPLLPEVIVRVEIRDPRDAPVVAAAVVGRAEAIVTGDRDILDDDTLRAWLRERGVEVKTPVEALRQAGD